MKKGILLIVALVAALVSLTACNQSVLDSDIYISEVMSDNVSTLADENGDMCDWIELHNPTEKSISLEGYILSDGSEKFTFPKLSVKPGEYLVVFADGTEKTDIGRKIIHVPFALSSSSGESVLLYNAKGRLVNSINLVKLNEDQSMGIDENRKVVVLPTPTPGKANTIAEEKDEAPEETAENNTADGKTILINEYATSANCTVMDEDGEFVGFVELYNAGDSHVSLSGYYLSDDEADKQKWAFPDVTIESGKYLVVYLSGKTKTYKKGASLHCDFKLKGDEDSLCLFDPVGNTVDSCTVYDLLSNLSCGRPAKDNGHFAFLPRRRPEERTRSKRLTVSIRHEERATRRLRLPRLRRSTPPHRSPLWANISIMWSFAITPVRRST